MTDTTPVQGESSATLGDAAPTQPNSNPEPSDTAAESAQPDVKDDGLEPDEERKDPELLEMSEKVQKRINKEVARARAAERELRQERQERQQERLMIQQLEERLAAIEKNSANNAKELSRDDFASEDEYQKALSHQEAQNAIAEYDKKRTEKELLAKRQQQSAQQHEDWLEREAQFAAKTPDYDEVVKAFGKLLPEDDPHVKQIGAFLITHPQGAELLYHVAKNRSLGKQIFSMKASFAVDELKSIAATLGQSKEPQKKTLPDPIKTTKGGSVATSKTPDQMSGKELLDWVRK